MSRFLFGLALVAALAACSESDEPPRDSGEWPSFTFADGAVSCSMPYAPERKTTDQGDGEARITEEIAACEYYGEGFGTCLMKISVISGPMLAKDMGSTEAERRNWSKLMVVSMLEGEEDKTYEEEGKWSFGAESGYWVCVALPKDPPNRTIPVLRWIKVSPVGDRALIAQFIGSQAAFENSIYRPKQDKVREKFFASLTAQ